MITTLAIFSKITPFPFNPSAGPTTSRQRKPISAILEWPPQCLHRINHNSIPPEKADVFKSLESWASEYILPLLKPVDECWQPSDFLPDSSKPVDEFVDRVRALRDQANGLPDEYFVLLAGDMIVPEAMPNYYAMMSALDGIRDWSVASPRPWPTWIRAWIAEVNRHGDLLRRYLYLSGRVDMVMIEKTVHDLVRSGKGTEFGHNPYLGFVYTSLQEQATFVSHTNMARLAKNHNEPFLASIYLAIANDENRHEDAHMKIVKKLLEVDPNETMLAIGHMMRNKVIMPAHLMHDNRDPHVFERLSYVAHRLGVYTTKDYADILEFSIERWGLGKLRGLEGDGRCEQEFVCSLVPKIRKLQEEANERAEKMAPRRLKFSWILNEEVIV